jgi:hypothetical protein
MILLIKVMHIKLNDKDVSVLKDKVSKLRRGSVTL